MNKRRFRKVIYFLILFLQVMCLTGMGSAFSAEFEIDEIITAIKQEIKTANTSELGSPKFSNGWIYIQNRICNQTKCGWRSPV